MAHSFHHIQGQSGQMKHFYQMSVDNDGNYIAYSKVAEEYDIIRIDFAVHTVNSVLVDLYISNESLQDLRSWGTIVPQPESVSKTIKIF